MAYAISKNQATLSTKEVAHLIGCSERTVRNMIEAGELSAIRLTGARQSRYRVSAVSVKTFLAAREQAGRK